MKYVTDNKLGEQTHISRWQQLSMSAWIYEAET